MDTSGPRIVELRVHGVSGTPPEQMLETAHVRQVSGDGYSRFFVPVDCFGALPHDPVTSGESPHQTSTRREAFHWGRYTSGNWRQALWLALIPFGFVNAAQFMLSNPTTMWQRVWHSAVGAALRLVAFGLTCTFALALSAITVDLIARQWVPTTGLGAAVGAGWLLGGGAAVAALAVYGLYLLGRRNTKVNPPRDPAGILGSEIGACSGLTEESFYTGDPDATSLSRLHLAGGVATVATVGVLTDAGAEGRWGHELAFLLSTSVLAVVAVVVTALGDPEGSASPTYADESARNLWRRTVQHENVGRAAALAALVALAVTLAQVVLGGSLTSTRTDAVERLANAFVMILTVTLLILFVSAGVLAFLTRDRTRPRRGPRTRDPFARYGAGMAAPVVAALGAFLGVGYAASFVLAANQIFGGAADLPPIVQSVTFVWGCNVLLAVLAGAFFALMTRARRSAREGRVRAAYGRVYGDSTPAWMTEAWIRRVATATALARLKNHVTLTLIAFSAFGVMLSALMVLERTPLGAGDDLAFLVVPQRWVDVLSPLGAWALIALAGLLMSTARQSLRVKEKQRTINVVWDVVSFWPRSVHPFVPPPYSQFAVQGLRDRIRHHLDTCLVKGDRATAPADVVVVEAHSQGSFIAVASLLWLTRDELARVGLLTFGSQLRVIFPRAFPAYVNRRVLESLNQAMDGRWINLFRDTDPIAGPVLSWDRSADGDPDPRSRRLAPTGAHEPDDEGRLPQPCLPDTVCSATGRRECGQDWRLLDPSPPDALLETDHLSPMLRHSRFPLSSDWDDAVAHLIEKFDLERSVVSPPVVSGLAPQRQPEHDAPQSVVGPMDYASVEPDE